MLFYNIASQSMVQRPLRSYGPQEPSGKSDADSNLQGLCVVAATNKFTWTTEVLWRKGTAWPLSE